MTFHDDIRIPVYMDRDVTGGPQFNTTIIKLFSGAERRNKNWQRSLGTWDAAYGITDKANLLDLINTFYAVSGMADGFRMKDWSDFQIGDTLGGDTTTKQAIGTGDALNGTYQIYKAYMMGSTTFQRTITRPVTGTLRVFWNSTEKTIVTDFTCDFTTGIITFPATKATGLLTLTGSPTDGDTVVVNGITYTFKTALGVAAGNVIFTNATDACAHLIAAVNGAAGAGTTYVATSPTPNSGAVAAAGTGTTVAFTAIFPGTVGNSVGTTSSITGGAGSFGSTTLTGGTGAVPGAGVIVSVMVEFDVPVRFATDLLSIDTSLFDSDAKISVPKITLQELKD